MSEARKQRGKAAAATGGRRKLSAAEKRRRAAERRRLRAEMAETERRAALSASELIAEDEAGQAKGAARTLVNAELYRTVYREWAEGMSYEDLSERHGLSRRRISEVVEDLKGARLVSLGVGDPLFSVKMAQQLVLQRSAAVSQYTRLAAEVTEASMAHVKLGSLKQRDAALSAFVELIQELGWLPRHLGSINVQMDALQMAEVLLEVFDAHSVPMDVQQAVVEAIELRVIKRGDRLALAGVGPEMLGDEVIETNASEVHDGSVDESGGAGGVAERGDGRASAAA
jgi:hypothetical protein